MKYLTCLTNQRMNSRFVGMKKCPPESSVRQLNNELCVILSKQGNQQPTLTADLRETSALLLLTPENKEKN